ncbi:hypothetical protein ACJRO7_017755 [Eucalyptus globulus]|uniref:Oligopeptide transporter n=1 Tax=Eucalyptus globulus TaxID=34317 RepID=A0ABD3KRE8_EUCGL
MANNNEETQDQEVPNRDHTGGDQEQEERCAVEEVALIAGEDQEQEERCAVEEVALVVLETDDRSLPVMTFRVWVLGLTSCLVLIFLNTFFMYRTQPLTISSILMQITVLPIGKFMARALPAKRYRFFGYSFTLNPGPFNIKEHVLITIFANCGVATGGVDAYSIGPITVMKTYYKQNLSFLCALIIVLTTQLAGYGWAGMFRKYLVDPAEMWWPANLAQVSLFRALHEKEHKSKGLTRMQFFLIALAVSFAYYVLPGYLFPVLTFFSWVCWAWPRSIIAQQIGSGYHGLGIGAFTLDWAGVSAYRGSPLVTPWQTIANVGVGFAVFIYMVVPLCYWKYNLFYARRFPIFSNQLFKFDGHKYDITKILTPKFDLDVAAYESYGKLYLNPIFAISTASGFARIAATFSHVALFHGSDVIRRSRAAMKDVKLDIHTKLMRRYQQVPQWWFHIIAVACVSLSVMMCIVWKDIVQLPWWLMILAFAMSWLVVLPIGVIQATTNLQPGYEIVEQILIGYILPGRPIATLLFKIYGRFSFAHALFFLSDLKLGHYMKIPPRCMFTVQLVASLVSGIVNLAVAWWMMGSIENICDVEALHPDSPWTCPKFAVTFDNSVIWGLIGPRRLFVPDGLYRNLVWLFLVGALLPLPIWALSKMFPEKKWIRLINIPVLSFGFAGVPPASPTNIASWLITGMFFNYFMFRYRKRWWQKYNYVLSAALDAGTAFMGVFLFFALQNQNKSLKWWGTEIDHCPLATCPTEPGVVVQGCPVFK